jgi:hypothetical protein
MLPGVLSHKKQILKMGETKFGTPGAFVLAFFFL